MSIVGGTLRASRNARGFAGVKQITPFALLRGVPPQPKSKLN